MNYERHCMTGEIITTQLFPPFSSLFLPRPSNALFPVRASVPSRLCVTAAFARVTGRARTFTPT